VLISGDQRFRWFRCSCLMAATTCSSRSGRGTMAAFSRSTSRRWTHQTRRSWCDRGPPSAMHPGYLLFRRDAALMVQPFDAKTLQLAGTPKVVVENVGFEAITYRALFSVSDDGMLAQVDATPCRARVVRPFGQAARHCRPARLLHHRLHHGRRETGGLRSGRACVGQRGHWSQDRQAVRRRDSRSIPPSTFSDLFASRRRDDLQA
jgi:hypothetical protein